MAREPDPLLMDSETAFRAMCAYIEAFWDRGARSSDDIAILLSILHDDPATPDDWDAAIRQVVG